MKVLDVWFSKPRLFKSNTGRWCCESIRSDEWRVVGTGLTPIEALEDMKLCIVGAYKRSARSVTFDIGERS